LCGSPPTAPQNAEDWQIYPQGNYVQYYLQCKANTVLTLGGIQYRSVTVECTITNGVPTFIGGLSSSGILVPNCNIPGTEDTSSGGTSSGGTSSGGVSFGAGGVPLPPDTDGTGGTTGGTTSGLTLQDCDAAVTSTALKFVSALDGAETPTATTCTEIMQSYDTCAATCAAGAPVAGDILCFNGTLLGASVCGSANLEAVTQITLRGTIVLLIRGSVNAAQIQKALADYLGVPLNQVTVVIKSATNGGRRLAAHSNQLWTYIVNYEVVVPAEQSANEIQTKLVDLNTGPGQSISSTASTLRFQDELVEESVSSENVFQTSANTAIQRVWADPNNNLQPIDLVIPAQSDPITLTTTAQPGVLLSPAPSPEEEGTNIAGIVGGLVGGFVGLALLAGIYVCMTRRSALAGMDEA